MTMVNLKKLEPEEAAADFPSLSPRQRLIAHLRSLAETHPEMDIPQLAHLAATLLPENDRALVADYLKAEASSILAWELNAQIRQTRNGIFAALDIDNPDATPVHNLSETRKETLYERIAAWREYLPSQNRTRPLVDMTRAELLESAQFDAGRAFHHGFKMMLKKRLADGLPSDSALVRDHFEAEVILEIGEQIKAEMNRGNYKLKILPAQPLPRPRKGLTTDG